MNNNKLDENALLAGCKGVFSKASYISIGADGKPEPYKQKDNARESFKGKQFATAPPKEGRITDVYFEKKHLWISEGDKYVDKCYYREAQGETKKKGFLTSDFSKRDEFSNTIRTEQWREQLTQEGKFAKAALDLLSKTAGGSTQQLSYTQARKEDTDGPMLYDLVYEKEDPNFSGASKTHRDTKNRTMTSHDRTFGGQLTTTSLAYQAPEEFHKPTHARKPIVRDTFYRKTNIFFPDGCAAAPE